MCLRLALRLVYDLHSFRVKKHCQTNKTTATFKHYSVQVVIGHTLHAGIVFSYCCLSASLFISLEHKQMQMHKAVETSYPKIGAMFPVMIRLFLRQNVVHLENLCLQRSSLPQSHKCNVNYFSVTCSDIHLSLSLSFFFSAGLMLKKSWL